jgi:hypothetical protein
LKEDEREPNMQPEQRSYVISLCDRVAREYDPDKFTALVQQLEVVLNSLHLAQQGPKTAAQ